MADDYYDQDLDQEAALRDSSEATGKEKEHDVEGETAVLPRAFCPDMDLTPGTTFKVKIERVFQDEILVSYVRGKKDEHDAPEEPDPLMD